MNVGHNLRLYYIVKHEWKGILVEIGKDGRAKYRQSKKPSDEGIMKYLTPGFALRVSQKLPKTHVFKVNIVNRKAVIEKVKQ